VAERRLDAAGAGEARVPQVKEVIGRRLRRLSEDCNEVLRLASVFGRDFEPEALARLAGLELDLLLDLLDQAIAARIVTDQHAVGGPFRFAHDLIRDTLYEALPASRRGQLHRQAGDALESLYAHKVEPHLAEVAIISSSRRGSATQARRSSMPGRPVIAPHDSRRSRRQCAFTNGGSS
jgi:hypothetical protein